jgi:hypothetical protein
MACAWRSSPAPGSCAAIWIPDPADEGIRDLARAREDAVNARTHVRQQLKGFLLRHEVRYGARTSWTKSFYRWLATLNFERSEMQTAFTEYWQAVTSADERVARLTTALASSINGWRFEPVVQALRALRGIDEISAIGLVAEIGDIGRFVHPRERMGYLGLVPSEDSRRRTGQARQHHEDRQRTCAAATHRGGVELPLHPAHWLPRAASRRSSAAGHPRYRLEGAGTPDWTLRAAESTRRADQQGLCGGGTRTRWLRLGHCLGASEAAAELVCQGR